MVGVEYLFIYLDLGLPFCIFVLYLSHISSPPPIYCSFPSFGRLIEYFQYSILIFLLTQSLLLFIILQWLFYRLQHVSLTYGSLHRINIALFHITYKNLIVPLNLMSFVLQYFLYITSVYNSHIIIKDLRKEKYIVFVFTHIFTNSSALNYILAMSCHLVSFSFSLKNFCNSNGDINAQLFKQYMKISLFDLHFFFLKILIFIEI